MVAMNNKHEYDFKYTVYGHIYIFVCIEANLTMLTLTILKNTNGIYVLKFL